MLAKDIQIERMRVFWEYQRGKDILIGCSRGIYRVEVNEEYQCAVKGKHMLDKNGSNFEVRKPGQSILVGWDENGVEKACLYDVNSRNILISL
jgi:hypothetical protein